MSRQIKHSSHGFTLVELLVSITILSIIVVTFLTFFIQSAKTNASSEDMLDATYVAQAQMEEIYNLSTKLIYSQVKSELDRMGYTSTDSKIGINASKIADEYEVMIRLHKPGEDHLGNVLTEVKDKTGKVRAKMQTTIKWQRTEGA